MMRYPTLQAFNRLLLPADTRVLASGALLLGLTFPHASRARSSDIDLSSLSLPLILHLAQPVLSRVTQVQLG